MKALWHFFNIPTDIPYNLPERTPALNWCCVIPATVDSTLFRNNFQYFYRTQMDFSAAPKCTIIEAINPYKIEIQK